MRLRGVPVQIFSVTYFVLSHAPLAIMGDEKGLEFPHQGEKPYRLPRTRSGQPGVPLGSGLIRNHPGKIDAQAHVAHIKRHPIPASWWRKIQIFRLSKGYPYYDGGYIEVDPQLDCYGRYGGDDLYHTGWYRTCDWCQ